MLENNRINVLFISANFEFDKIQNYTMPFIDRQMEALIKKGVNVIPFSLEIHKNKLNYFLNIIKVYKIIRKKNISIIHAHYLYSSIPCTLLKIRPVVVSLMGTDVFNDVGYTLNKKLKNILNPILVRLLSLKWDTIIVKSKFMKNDIRHPDINVIPNGVDFNKFYPISQSIAKKQINLDTEKNIILFGGNPNNLRKNYKLALNSFRKVFEIIKNVTLIPLVGIPHNEVPLYLNSSSCLLMTSFNEGSPNIIKEALACNVPVVTVNVGDVSENFKNLEACTICDYDPDIIAKEIIKIIKSKNRPNNREKIKYLDNSIIADKIINIYKKLI